MTVVIYPILYLQWAFSVQFAKGGIASRHFDMTHGLLEALSPEAVLFRHSEILLFHGMGEAS
jgi:hypothetical protein